MEKLNNKDIHILINKIIHLSTIVLNILKNNMENTEIRNVDYKNKISLTYINKNFYIICIHNIQTTINFKNGNFFFQIGKDYDFTYSYLTQPLYKQQKFYKSPEGQKYNGLKIYYRDGKISFDKQNNIINTSIFHKLNKKINYITKKLSNI